MKTVEDLAAEVIERIRPEYGEEISELPKPFLDEPYTYRHTHVSVGMVPFPTFEEAFQDWRAKLLAFFNGVKPAWVWWRVPPEVVRQVNPETDSEEWRLYSRCAFPTPTEKG